MNNESTRQLHPPYDGTKLVMCWNWVLETEEPIVTCVKCFRIEELSYLIVQ